jgi:hypothetical protein
MKGTAMPLRVLRVAYAGTVAFLAGVVATAVAVGRPGGELAFHATVLTVLAIGTSAVLWRTRHVR